MNVYDFDKTIYRGDSTLDFYFFCLKKQPFLLILLSFQILGLIQYKLGLCSKLEFKEKFYIFLKHLKNRDEVLQLFWLKNNCKIQPWYLKQQKVDDLIISASPEFLLKPICDELGIIRLIASNVDFESGKCLGENCYGTEKPRRYDEQYKNIPIYEFYSDSLTDTPMAKRAMKSYGVLDDKLMNWDEFEQTYPKSSIKKEFLLFLVVGVINTFNGVLFATLFSLIYEGTVSFILGYAISLIISYILNSIVVFKNKLSTCKLVKFSISYIPNFLIQLIMVVVFLHYFAWEGFIVYTLSAILGVPITFLMVKFFALKK